MKSNLIHWLMLPILTAGILMCCSCGLVGWAAAQFDAAQKVKPIYVPPAKGKKVLVFVDDSTKPVSYQPIKRLLMDKLNNQLSEHKIVGEVVPYERLLDLMSSQRKFDQLTITAIGKLVGADLVLYVDIVGFQLKETSEMPMWDGQLETTVRWIDVHAAKASQARLWPMNQSGYAVPAVSMPQKEDASANYSAELSVGLAEKMADRIAKLFYEHDDNPEPLVEP